MYCYCCDWFCCDVTIIIGYYDVIIIIIVIDMLLCYVMLLLIILPIIFFNVCECYYCGMQGIEGVIKSNSKQNYHRPMILFILPLAGP